MTRIHEITPDELEAAARKIAALDYEFYFPSGTRLEEYIDETWSQFEYEAKHIITAFLEHRAKKGQGDE